MAIEQIRIANGTAVAVRDAAAHTLINNLTSAVNSKVNKNFLDNWYFADPINQRGQTTYTNSGFTIDRWKFSSSGATLTINSGYISISAGSSDHYLMQTLSGFDWTRTYTISVMLNDGTIVSATDTYAAGVNLPDGTYFYTTYDSATGLFKVQFKVYSGVTINVKAVKLEYGSVSTLSGDSAPKKSEQLLECQRYYIRYANDSDAQFAVGATVGTTVFTSIQLPTAMYGTSSVDIGYSNVDIYPFISDGAVAATSVSGYLTGGRQACIIKAGHAANTNLPAKSPASIRIKAGGYVSLSCEI